MARFSKATWHPVQNYTTDGQDQVLGLIVHIMEGSIDGTQSWFNNPSAQASSHFGNGKSGDLRQWVDTKDRAWAQAAGNRTYLSIENEGSTPDALTPQQVENVAQVLAWAHKLYGVPLQKANAPGEHGLGWHGMGGDAWGGHFDCPGDHIRAQFDEIIARAEAIVGAPGPTPTPIYAPFPGRGFFHLGQDNALITEMGKALIRAGYKARYTPTPNFTRADLAAYSWWQRKLGYSGSDADGYPGPTSWAQLKVARPS